VQLLILDDGVGGAKMVLPADGEISSRLYSIRHRRRAISAASTARRGRNGGAGIPVHLQPDTQLSDENPITRQEVF
jgi:hypothetical protein